MEKNNKFYGFMIFVLVAASFVFCWKSVIPKYQENKKQTAQLEQDIKTAKIKLESLKTTKADIDMMGDVVNQMLISVPGDKDTPNLITELETIATQNKTYIPSIQISDGASSSTTTVSSSSSTVSSNQVSIAFSVDGTFTNLNAMMTALENDIRFMNINAVTLSNSSTNASEDKLSMSVQLTAFKRATSSVAAARAPGI